MKDDIHKAGGIIIQNRKLLVTRSRNEEIFIAPGGKLEVGETPKQALVRELAEELQIKVTESDLTEFGIFSALAAYDPTKIVHMTVFMVSAWVGELQPNREIAEIAWIDSTIAAGWNLGSIFEHDVLPRLKAQSLID